MKRILFSLIAAAALTASAAETNTATFATFASYAPTLKNPVGAGIAGIFPITEQFGFELGTQARLQYLDTGTSPDSLWLPNGLLVLSRPIPMFRDVTVRPMLDMGGAADFHCRPYSILGAGIELDILKIESVRASIFYGIEEWNGPYNKFTVHHAGVAVNIPF